MLEICLKNGNSKVEMILIQSSAATDSKEALHQEMKVLEHHYIKLFKIYLHIQITCTGLQHGNQGKVQSCIVTHAGNVLYSVLISFRGSTVLRGGGV